MPLAAIRPDDWNFPLLLHVLGAMLLVGALVTTVTVFAVAWRRSKPGEVAVTDRLGFRTLLYGVIPAWILMRLAGEWIYSKENWDDVENEPDWLGVGYLTGDLGLPVILLSTILAGIGVRRARGGGGSVLTRIAFVLSAILLLAYLVAMWAMTAKPD